VIDSLVSLSLPAERAARVRWIVLASLGVLVAGWGLLHLPPYRIWLRGDIIFYENWGTWSANHLLAYRDFPFDYPPGALPVMTAPLYLRSKTGAHGLYETWFHIEMLFFAAIVLLAMAWTLVRLNASERRLAGALMFAAVSPFALGPVSIARYDLWPACLASVGLAAVVAGRRRLGMTAIALGAAAKIYPVVLLPILLVEAWRRRGTREVVVLLGIFLVVVVATFAPFVALAPHGLWDSFHGQASRPLQIESVGAAGMFAAHQAAGTNVNIVKSHGSDNLAGRVPDLLGGLSSAAVLVSLVVVWLLFARGPTTNERLVTAAAAAVVAYIAFNKVFSPQYLIWLVPLVPLVRGRRGLIASVLLGIAIVMTQIWEPYTYGRLLRPNPDATISWLIVVRDLIVVALLAVLLKALWPRREASGPVESERLAPRSAAV
jgi:uncharacterized membrane protein